MKNNLCFMLAVISSLSVQQRVIASDDTSSLVKIVGISSLISLSLGLGVGYSLSNWYTSSYIKKLTEKHKNNIINIDQTNEKIIKDKDKKISNLNNEKCTLEDESAKLNVILKKKENENINLTIQNKGLSEKLDLLQKDVQRTSRLWEHAFKGSLEKIFTFYSPLKDKSMQDEFHNQFSTISSSENQDTNLKEAVTLLTSVLTFSMVANASQYIKGSYSEQQQKDVRSSLINTFNSIGLQKIQRGPWMKKERNKQLSLYERFIKEMCNPEQQSIKTTDRQYNPVLMQLIIMNNELTHDEVTS